ncbi:hypothetical protein VTI74DRAFT_1270 [Chaetomium olivicolor]
MAQNTSPSGAEDEGTSTVDRTESHVLGGMGEHNRLEVASLMAVDDPGMDATTDRLADASAAIDGPTSLGRKRKSHNDSAGFDSSETTSNRECVKKAKLAEDDAKGATPRDYLETEKTTLPPEVWHHIFTFCPPKSLGNLLAVNKLFNLYLDPASSVQRGTPAAVDTRRALAPLEPNAIWQASRRLFWPQMPAPLRSKTELEMWRLACSPSCQECGKRSVRRQAGPPDPRHPGPGSEGVAAIWAFGSRMCGPCLLKKSVKEVDLLLSPSIPSSIMSALPFVFLTQDLDAFSATALEQSQLPAGLQVTKLFPSSDVEALRQEFLQVKDMGQGTVSEWLKGLDSRGSAMQHDASKWEKWESSGGTAKMCAQLYPGHVRIAPVSLPRKPSAGPGPAAIPCLPIPPGFRQSSSYQGRQERSAEEVAELKAARKAEIERRALLLDPPLTTDVLHHIPSFQAATHIVAPLDDHAWKLLKPRLLAQRAEAERIQEAKRRAESQMQQELQASHHLEATLATTKEVRDRIDKLWEEVQAPLRAKICGFADEVIHDSWGNGKKVTKENCSRFAVESLLHIRRRFYDDVAREASAARAAGRTPLIDPPEGPFTQKLTLENMKWIFDTKIKPHTEDLRKELFYCSSCEGNFKPFGFEGVIQHYAAKHTNALSLGNIVVHWRAEWPEHPPFSATARPAKAAFQPNVPTPFPIGSSVPPPAGYSYLPPAPAAVPVPPPPYPPAIGYGYTPPVYSDYYQPPVQQPFKTQPGAPSPFMPQQLSYEQQPPYAGPPAPFSSFQPQAMPYPLPAVEPAHGYMAPHGGQHDYHHGPYPTPGSVGPYVTPQTPAFPNVYQSKVEDIARNSREVWRLLGDIKDLPGSVRVFVTIHHLVKRFRSRFYETPPLAMFIDGLSNNKEMRPVRNVNGLVCKTCHLGLSNAASVEQDRKYFSLPQLANHFQSKHVEPIQAENKTPLPDWALDMVLLPDDAIISNLASSVSESQRALLTAAFPLAFAPQPASAAPQSYAGPQRTQPAQGPAGTGGQLPMPANSADESWASSGYGARPSVLDRSSAATQAGLLASNQSSSHTSQSATPGAVSENDRSTDGDGGRRSSQGSRLAPGQNGFKNKKRGNSKNKRAKPQGGREAGERAFGKRLNVGDENTQGGEADGHAMRTTYQGEPVSADVSSIRPDRIGTTGPSLQFGSSRADSIAHGTQEPDILAALESHLEQRRLPQFRRHETSSNAIMYQERLESGMHPDWQHGPEPYPRHSDREDRPASPPLKARYQAAGPTSRERELDGRQLDAAYYPRPAPVERREEAYAPQRPPSGFVEPLPRHVLEEERFGLQAPRLDDHNHRPIPPAEGEYRRHPDEIRMASRPPPVETYEIVHVIDGYREYYYRRPVRREPKPRYIYEERRLVRDAGAYPASHDPLYAPVSRASLVRDGPRASVAPEAWPADQRRADPAYDEEYDPRFPAA